MRAPARTLARVAVPALAAAAVVLGAALKLTVEAGGPLWLDEGWSLGVVESHGWPAFVRQLQLDVNPPLYFLLLRGWTALFGTGDGALRSLSTLAAGLLPAAALLPGAGVEPRDRWAWAALLSLWGPGVAFAQEARGYALLALLAACQTVLFAHLLARPSRPRAFAWSAAATLAALTQHHALLLVAVQGATLLAVERRRALRLWPAAVVFAPLLAWDAMQAPRIVAFGRPEHAWYPPLTVAIGEGAGETLVGAWPAALGALALAGAAAATTRARGRPAPAMARKEAALWAAAGASVVGGLVLIALGALRPSLAPRYLAPFAPGALLAPVLMLRAAAGWPRTAAALALIAGYAGAAVVAADHADPLSRRAYQMETASTDLGAAGVRRLAFLWDNPTDAVLEPEQRAALAGAFFARAGRRIVVTGVHPPPGGDPNPALAETPADGLLWLYDLRVPHTAARRFPPQLEAADPRLACRRYAGGALGVVACVRRPLRWPT